jgi:hypothetical protein
MSAATGQSGGGTVALGNRRLDRNQGWNREPQITPNAKTVLERRYLKKDESGKPVETPRELFERVAKAIALAEANYGKSETEIKAVAERFYEMMAGLEFMPNSLLRPSHRGLDGGDIRRNQVHRAHPQVPRS